MNTTTQFTNGVLFELRPRNVIVTRNKQRKAELKKLRSREMAELKQRKAELKKMQQEDAIMQRERKRMVLERRNLKKKQDREKIRIETKKKKNLNVF